MIRNNPLPSTHTPKHRSEIAVYDYDDVRTYHAHVCPGQHCLGRARGDGSMRVGHGHRHGGPNSIIVHTLTPKQAKFSGRVR